MTIELTTDYVRKFLNQLIVFAIPCFYAGICIGRNVAWKLQY